MLFGDFLIGDKGLFTLESRIFHSVCIFVIVGLALGVPLDYFTGFPQVALLMFVVLLVGIFIYYISRFKNKLDTGIIMFQIANNLFLFAHYYYNSGINGPSYSLFMISFFITVAIVPKKQYWIWLPVNVALLLGLIYTENTRSDWIVYTYTNTQSRSIEFGYSYVIMVLLILLVTAYIRSAYHKEHNVVELKAQALESSNNTKNKLLSIISHDLKEPLSSIQGFLELLTEYQLEDSERIKIEKELLSRTKDTSYMLSNILSWAKRQMESVNVNLVPLKLLSTLGDTLQTMKAIAKEKGIELKHDLTDEICLLADKDMLQLVIRNLIINAIKFSYPGGTIIISAEVKANKCMISVSDTGQGIPAAKQGTLFSIAASSTFGTAKEKGIGLGLVLCSEFTELQGGEIGFTSEEKVGSTFFISLKLCYSTKNDNLLYSKALFYKQLAPNGGITFN